MNTVREAQVVFTTLSKLGRILFQNTIVKISNDVNIISQKSQPVEAMLLDARVEISAS
jgi:hypothetical protein